MASQLPTIPRTIFTIVEPISLIAGCLSPLVNVDWFIASQIDTPVPVPTNDNARLVALQLGNAYGLLFMVGVAVLFTTSELKVVRNYLVALLLADITHVGVTLYLLGPERASNPLAWNAMTWGNVGATSFLCLNRVAYFLGMFGKDDPANKSVAPSKKRK